MEQVYLVSVVPVCSAHDKPGQMSGHYAKTVNFKLILTYYYFTNAHNWTYNTIGWKMSVV